MPRVYGSRKRMFDSLELELLIVVSHYVQCRLGIERRLSGRAASALNCGKFSRPISHFYNAFFLTLVIRIVNRRAGSEPSGSVNK